MPLKASLALWLTIVLLPVPTAQAQRTDDGAVAEESSRLGPSARGGSGRPRDFQRLEIRMTIARSCAIETGPPLAIRCSSAVPYRSAVTSERGTDRVTVDY